MPLPKELNLGIVPSPSGGGETMLANAERTLLVFHAADLRARTAHVAIATFPHCTQCIQGYPNDEAWTGHPHYGPDGWSYGFYEVEDSDWNARLSAQNRAASARNPTPFADPDLTPRRHFIVAGHEGVVEVLADDIVVEIFAGSFTEALAEASRRVMEPD